ncbi:MAG: 50S ribosomal protein L25/general stress protein Ctc [Parvularculales bacterium]
MADTPALAVEPRQTQGKGAARALRRSGRVPGVVYGRTVASESISLEPKTLNRLIQTGSFMSTPLTLTLEGKEIRVIPRAMQRDPIRDSVMHVDFMLLNKDTSLTVEVPVQFINEEASPGLKRGGVLNIVRHEVELLCPADKIPEYIVVDVGGGDVGDSFHISHVALPDGVTPTITDRDFTIATVAAPAALRGEEEETAEDTEATEDEASEEASSENSD